MFEYDWAFQPRVLLPLVVRDYIAPPDHLLISKVFYLGSTTPVTGSEWVQVYNPTGITLTLGNYKLGDQRAWLHRFYRGWCGNCQAPASHPRGD
jgi:hypothetical protein